MDRLIRAPLIEGVFEARIATKAGNHFIAGLVLGAKADDVLNGKKKIMISSSLNVRNLRER